MKKKISKILIMAMVVSSMLVGCGNKKDKTDVTAEELLNGVKETADKGGKYNDIEMTFDVAGKIDASAFMGESADATLMEAALNGTVNAKTDEDTTGTEGTMTIKMMGMEMPETIKSWTQDNGDGTETSYSFDTESSEWTYITAETVKDEESDSESDNVKDIIDAIKDCKVESTSDGYQIKGALDIPKLLAMAEEASGTDGAVSGVVDSYKEYAEKVNINVSIDFDKDKNLKSVELKADKIEEEKFVLENAVITLKINALAGTDALDVPEDVVSNAKEFSFE